MSILLLIISFLSSVIGAICGIGGGVIIKPVLDSLGILSVNAINFLSACTVLSMAVFSFLISKISKENVINMKVGTPLAIGAAIGGLIGKSSYHSIAARFTNQDTAGAIQASILGIITVGTLVYTLHKKKIRTKHLTGLIPCLIIGGILGFFSSFLGIGGGPINLIVLFYFFSMETKTAAANSLYIILFSQLTSVINTLIKGVPPIEPIFLTVMICGGICGGIVGRKINKKIKTITVEKLFLLLMIVLIIINIYNVYRLLS